MKRAAQGPFLALLIAFAAQAPVRAETATLDGFSASGLRIVPRYIEKVGDLEVAVFAGAMALPLLGVNAGLGQVSLVARFTEPVALFVNLGPLAEVGARGMLYEGPLADLGWDASYRMDSYLAAASGFGIVNPLDLPSSIGQGFEMRLNAMNKGAVNLYLSPVYSVLSNRTALGAELGVDYPLGNLTLGYGLNYRKNLSTKPVERLTLQPYDLSHSLGARYRLSGQLGLQANYQFQQVNSYDLSSHLLLVGADYRFSMNQRR